MTDVLHVDMDAFFASVEVKDNPELKGKPVIVAGLSKRGVVAACTYEARIFGVRSGMSTLMAKRLCPDGMFVGGRYSRYVQISKQLEEVLISFSPYVEFVSLDEAFVDVTKSHRLFGSNRKIAELIVAKVANELDLNCSVGIGSSKLIAKIASKKAKPNVIASTKEIVLGTKIFEVEKSSEIEFISDLELKEIWGIGPKTVAKLNSYGIYRVKDLKKIDDEVLVRLVKSANAKWLSDILNAEDSRKVAVERVTKSISVEATYENDLTTPQEIFAEIPRMVDSVVTRLKSQNFLVKTVTVKLKDKNFKIITRSQTLNLATDDIFKIYEASKNILERYMEVTERHPKNAFVKDPTLLDENKMAQDGLLQSNPNKSKSSMPRNEVPLAIRLVGVSLSNLVVADQSNQLGLFDETEVSKLTEVIYNVKNRFGPNSIAPASLIKDGELIVKTRGDAQWG